MKTAQCRDAGVVDLRARYTAGHERGAQFRPIAFRLSQQHQTGSFQLSLHLSKRGLEGAGRIVNVRMRNDGEELVEAGPGNCPSRPAFRQFGEASIRGFMPG